MKKSLTYKLTILFIFIINLAALNLQAQTYQKIQKGLDYATLTPKELGTKLHLLRVHLKYFDIKPITSTEATSVKIMAKNTGALAVLNANFFDRAKRPLGLILEEGKIRNGFHPTQWWACFLVKNQQAKIARVFKKKHIKGYQYGVQAGPRIVFWGRPLKLKESYTAKSIVGIDRNNRVILLASEGKVSMKKLANFLAKPKGQGGLGWRHALNLDGGSSTQFFIHTPQTQLWLSGFARVPVGLGVFAKRMANPRQ